MSGQPSLTKLKGMIQEAGVYAEDLRVKYPDYSCGTGYTVDATARELEHLYEVVSDEIKVLERNGEDV